MTDSGSTYVRWGRKQCPGTNTELVYTGDYIYIKCLRGKNKHLTAQKSNSNTVWFNFQTYIIFSINLVSQVTLRSNGTDILYGCHLLRCLYNILYFLWLYNEFCIILYNILIMRLVLQCINGVSSNPVERRSNIWQLKNLILTLFGLICRRIYIYMLVILRGN